jgi:hypothetical protein
VKIWKKPKLGTRSRQARYEPKAMLTVIGSSRTGN